VQRLNRFLCMTATLVAVLVILPALGVTSNLLFANTLCVNPGGTGGCFPSISAAVTAASPNATIKVSAGTYAESVVINKPLSIVGASRVNTFVNAASLPNGFNIDGMNNPGLANVTVTGFTVKNANFEGVVATNASFLNIWGNNVINNDKRSRPHQLHVSRASLLGNLRGR
jgi:pectin methylesterase-like acyl-CoA thioesterase